MNDRATNANVAFGSTTATSRSGPSATCRLRSEPQCSDGGLGLDNTSENTAEDTITTYGAVGVKLIQPTGTAIIVGNR